MKLKLSYKVFSVLLALLVLASTLSLAIEKHFCGDVLVDVAVFSEVKKCCPGDSENASPEITKDSCCKNEIEILEGQDELTLKTYEDLDDVQQQFLLAYAYSYVCLYESLPKRIVPHKDYSPPLLIRDIQVLDETYLI